MTQPAQDGMGAVDFIARWQHGAVDQDDRQVERAGGEQLGLRAGAAGIFAEDKLDAMRLHQGAVAFHVEGATIDDQAVIGQHGRRGGRIDEAQQIMMLGLRGKGIDMHPAQREHDAAWRPSQGSDGPGNVRHMGPAVARLRAPCRASQRDQRHGGDARGLHRVGAHLRGEGVRGVDQMGDAMVAQMAGQPLHPAKAADPHRHRLRAGMVGAPGIAERRGHIRVGQQTGERAGLARAAQQQDVGHG